MKKYILLAAMLLTAMTSKAHGVDISSVVLVEQEDDTWILQINSSLTAFQHEIRAHFGEGSYKTPQEFRQLVLDHLKKNIHINFNGEKNSLLKNGTVRLGHETQVAFEVVGIPSDMNSAFIQNTAFKDIHRNQSVLFILKKGFDKAKFVMSKDNGHTLALHVKGSKFSIAEESSGNLFSYGMILLSLFGLFALWIFIQKVHRSKKNPLTTAL